MSARDYMKSNGWISIIVGGLLIAASMLIGLYAIGNTMETAVTDTGTYPASDGYVKWNSGGAKATIFAGGSTLILFMISTLLSTFGGVLIAVGWTEGRMAMR